MKGIHIFFGSVVLIIALFIGTSFLVKSQPGKYDAFATCIKDSGAIFYGAFWCPHCQSQKALFGRSAKLLPYFECSTPDGQGQLQVCTDKGVTNYPTWHFPNGEVFSGELSIEELSERTSCQLPR